MSVPESILYALFCMVVVFVVLIMLWAIIRVFSFLTTMIEKKQTAKKPKSKS